MKKIYSFLMALSIVLCANANSFEVAKSLEISMARPQVSKKVNVTPSQGATPVINKTIQVKKQALNAQQQESKAIARQAQQAPAVKVNGVRGAEVATMPTAAKQVMPVATKNKQMAAAQVTEATDTVEIVGYEWTYEYYSDTKDWYMAVIDASQTYVVRLDYLVAEEDFAGTYNIDNLDLDYSYLTIYDEDRNKTYVNYVEADFTVSVTEEGKFLTANLLCENGIRYLVTAEELPLPEPIGNAELAYTNATLEDGTRSSETFQFWADENGVYTSFLIASDEVVGEYTQDDMYVAYANYIMFVDGTDTTFVDFLGFDMAITKEGQTYNLVADALGSDTIMYHITMSYTKPAPTDTIDIVATNMVVDEYEFWGMYFCEVSASNADYTVTLNMANGLPLGELTYEDFNVENSSVYRIADATEIVFDDIISATVSMVDGQRAIKAQVVGVDNILYNLDLSYVIPEATDTVNVVFDQAAVATYYAQFGDYYIYNESKDYLVSLDIFEEEGNLMGEYTAEDFDLEYTQVGVVADSTVVTIVDAKAVVTPVEEDIVHIVAELLGQNGTLYIVSTDADVSKKGLQYDAPSGAVDRTYTNEEITFNEGNGYFQIVASSATASDKVAMVLFAGKDENTIIPVGTYEINGTQTTGTVLASSGVNGNSVTLSLYGKTNAQGNIIVPCYFLVGGTVEVSATDGVLTIEVNAVNSYDVPVHIVMTYDLDTKQGLKYDEQTGSVDRTYTSKDNILIDTDYVMLSNLFVDIVAEDYSDQLSLQFFVSEADEEIGIPVGTYPITSDNKMNTILAGQGVSESGSVAPSFYSTLVEQDGEHYLDKLYFLVSGQAVVEKINGKLKMTIDAVNSYDVPVHIVYDGTDDVETGVENTVVENGASKMVENNQLFIIKDGVKYNIMGSVVK